MEYTMAPCPHCHARGLHADFDDGERHCVYCGAVEYQGIAAPPTPVLTQTALETWRDTLITRRDFWSPHARGDRAAMAKKLAKDGMPQHEIARRLNVHIDTIRDYLYDRRRGHRRMVKA